MNTQRTLAKTVTFSGTGLHSGCAIRCDLRPARPDSGIVFILEQPNGSIARIPARFKNIGALTYNTGLRGDGGEILTVEHLLSALHGYQVDNCEIHISDREVPVMDGSASPFIYLLSEAGIIRQNAPRRSLRLTRPVRVDSGDAWIEATPTDDRKLSIEYHIDFPHPSIGAMAATFSEDPHVYAHAIAPARTFGFLREVEYLREKGLIRGASLHNAVVLDDHRIISGELRFPDEFVRHKILDFWGDIVLLGHHLVAHVHAVKAGHRLHAMLVETLLKTPDLLAPVDQKVPHRVLHWQPAVTEASAP
ncbi:UDP-3-O-[3-hydroxymyristoyl] N-acetylglucosamine deacetylase [bacterium]|nr:UDP-3-O-[3-hydroxymyristoyl] N-acetylglucosamine deacetylase [candidate division CSSED10-310 bacterium]